MTTSSQILVITGPESSGKSTLATQLCDCIQAPLVPEMAREYLTQKQIENTAYAYQEQDLSAIAKLQHKQEAALLPFQPQHIVCDTDLLVIMIWSEVRYGKCDHWITQTFEKVINSKNPRHYFLCDWNIPWQTDPLRENPDNRDELYARYLQKLTHYQLQFTSLTGNQQERLSLALASLN